MTEDGEAIQPPTPSPRLLQLQPLRRPRPRVLGWGPSLTRRQRSLWSGQLEPMASDGPYGSSLDGPTGDAEYHGDGDGHDDDDDDDAESHGDSPDDTPLDAQNPTLWQGPSISQAVADFTLARPGRWNPNITRVAILGNELIYNSDIQFFIARCGRHGDNC